LCIVVFGTTPCLLMAQPVANFTANNTSGCAPVVVQFTDQSTGSPTTWYWNLGNNTTSTLQNPSTTYTTAGTYTVTLMVTNASGSSTKTISNIITVSAPPFANFVADDSGSTCLPKTINFQNTSVSNSTGTTTYLWDFGDGTTSTSTNPSHTYTTSGNYNVTLIVTNAAGCTKNIVKTAYIQALPSPIVNFTSSNNIACNAPTTVNFTSTSATTATYSWNFGDGGTSTSTNPAHSYNATGTYNVTLIAIGSNGCADTAIKNAFVVIAHPTAAFSASNSSACMGTPFIFTNQSLPATVNSLWSFGDGNTSLATSPTHSYTASGTYTVKLVSSAGSCPDSTTQTVTVLTKPIVNFTSNSTWGCTTPFTVQFQDNTVNGNTWAWRFGDGSTSTSQNPSHTYSATGSYSVTLVVTNSNGCTDSLTKTNNITIGTPSATVSAVAPAGTCTPATFNFNAVISPNITPTSFSYNYGDGTSGSSSSHTYTTAGTYTVTYTYTLAAGCTYTATTAVTAGTRPTASFTAAPLTTCPATNITFTNNSTGALYYQWLYGDGLSGTATNPIHSYEITGSATVTLIAFGVGGCADTMVRPNYVTVLLPHAQFTPSYTCSNSLQVNFTDNSNGADTWSWHFGDGATSTTQNPTHTYASGGTDTVTLTVHNNTTGCNDTYILIINLTSAIVPFLQAADSTTCKNTPVVFNTSSFFVSYLWNFGDGTVNFAGSSTSHTYSTAGVYTVKVTLFDSRGCIDTVTKTNYVSVGGPTAAFSASAFSGCLPLNVQFTDQSTTIATAAITSRVWKYGDGSTTTGNSVGSSHTYTTTGSFPVSLVVTDANGCTDSIVKPNYIQATKPHALFTTNDTTVCINSNVNFVNSSTGNNLTYLWSFGDGITSFAVTPFHAYTTAGAYTISLIVTDATGCKDTMTRTAYVHIGTLYASFNINDSFATCPPLTVNATNTTPGTNTYTWSFGNGGQSVLTNPTTVYTYPGVYHIKLTVHNASGCADSTVRNVAVLGPTGTFNINTFAGCSPLTVLLSVTNTSGATSYTWDLNNGYTQSTTATSFNYTYTQPGKYVPLVVISNGTCQVPVVGDTVYSDHLNADFTFPSANYCTPAPVSFTDTSSTSLSPIASRTWSFGDGTTGTGHNPVHTYTSGGTYQVRLIISNVSGCTDTIIKTITINQKPAITITGNQPICPGQAAQVTLAATGAATYSWAPGTGLACSTCSSTIVLPAATTTYTLIGTSTNGCRDTVTTTVVVNTLPTVSTGTNQTICANHSATLGASGASTYLWSPATGLSCTTCANPVANPPITTVYTVKGTSTNGCSATASVTVFVNAVPVSLLDSSTNICIGKSVSLPGTATGAVSYLWYPATGLSCTTCAIPFANPTVTTTYSEVTQAGNGCNDTAHIVVIVNTLPVISVGSQNVCAHIPTQVTATGAQTYVWSPAAGLSCSTCPAPYVNIGSNTAYTITGTDAHGCIDSTSVLFTVINRVPTSVGNGDSICQGTTVQLSASGGISYSWIPANGVSDPTGATPTATPNGSINYIVYIKENQCFTDTGIITVIVYPVPTVNAGANQTILDGQTVHLDVKNSPDVVSFSWSPTEWLSCTDCQSPSATPQKSTTYTVTVTGQGGCKDSAQTTVFLKCQNGQVFIPNIFTPNGDGANDKFYVSGKGIINVKRFSVYNRWGEEVYSAADVPVNDPNSGWDGKYKGQLLKPDVFVYAITVVCESGELLDYKGDVSLIQ